MLFKRKSKSESQRAELLNRVTKMKKSGKFVWDEFTSQQTGEYLKLITVRGHADGLTVAISFNFMPRHWDVGTGSFGSFYTLVSEGEGFKAITISQKGSGSVEMDDDTSPKHWFWILDPNITHLMKSASGYAKRQEAFRKDKDLSDKRHDAEQSSREVLSHLAA